MNKYIIPVCEIPNSKIYNLVIMAKDFNACKDKIIHKYEKYSESDDWDEFIDDLDKQDILIGEIADVELV